MNAVTRKSSSRIPTVVVAALVGLAWLAAASAAVAAPQRAQILPLNAERLLEMVLGLGVVLALIVLAAWVMRRVLRIQPSVNGRMRILGALSLGARERIVLLQVGGSQLVVGVAPGRIQTLHLLDEPLPVTPEEAEQTVSFQRQVRAALRGFRGGAQQP